MRIMMWLGAALLLAGCAVPTGKNTTAKAIQLEMEHAVQGTTPPARPVAVDNALMPPLSAGMPQFDNKPLEVRFDMSVSNTPVTQVFLAIVSGTRYSMLFPPDVSGNISLNLKDVTVFEALEAIREVYGYEYKVDGARIYIQSPSLQTRIFQVSYLTGLRAGASQLRVSGGSVADVGTNTPSTSSTTTTTTSSTSRGQESSKVTMTSSTDFWDELGKSLQAIVGTEKGRSVVVSPMSGVIVVRAMPDELRNVAAYLKASQISIERQVILEAKIIEVKLNDGFQSGINWGVFKNGPNSHVSIGQVAQGAKLVPGTGGTAAPLTPGSNTGFDTNLTTLTPGANMGGGSAASLFGLAFQTSNFAALLNFLESQGSVHVLSSPRIATLNNQKAVLKVGADEFFVTNVSNTTTTGTATTSTPSVTLQPFFSGIVLDVTPRIDQNNEIILHIHPSVSSVTDGKKQINAGAAGMLELPLAKSTISETDSIVRARDGQIVAIGGLMRQTTFDNQSGLPGLPKQIFGQVNKSNEKYELVILLKPTVVDIDKDWAQDITQSRDRLDRLNGQGVKP